MSAEGFKALISLQPQRDDLPDTVHVLRSGQGDDDSDESTKDDSHLRRVFLTESLALHVLSHFTPFPSLSTSPPLPCPTLSSPSPKCS